MVECRAVVGRLEAEHEVHPAVLQLSTTVLSLPAFLPCLDLAVTSWYRGQSVWILDVSLRQLSRMSWYRTHTPTAKR